jgi:alpha-tubulin suppressor-like RCC1 family protein
MKQIFFVFIALLGSSNSFGQIVDGGNGHALILDKKGNVWTIGRNNYGQLGHGTLINADLPKKIKSIKNIIAISRGYDHSIALNKNGELYLWGRNNYGQLGSASINDQLEPQKLPNHKNFIAVEGGYWHTVALKKEGTVWSWGHNFYAELGNGTREHSPWPVIVLQKINNDVSILNNVVSIASVGYHTLALKDDGTVWGWGGNSFNELGKKGEEFQQYAIKVEGIPKVKEIAVGWHHSVALDVDGNLWIWGSDPAYQFKEETRKHYDHPIQLEGLPKFIKVACGSWHSLAIDEENNVWAWGKNHFGMLGTGDTISHSEPILNAFLKNIVDIGGGCFQSIAVDNEGKIFTFGDNPSGQLGIGNFTRCFSPKVMALDMNGILSETDKTNLIQHLQINDTVGIKQSATVKSPMKNNLKKEPNAITTSKAEILPIASKSNENLTYYNYDIYYKIIKYTLFLCSLVLNIILFRKLKNYQ